jgi:ABC-type amino acid transport substrate-binding protein
LLWRAEAGNLSEKNEPRFTEYVDETLLALEASGEAAKIFDKWFAPSPRLFKFRRD